MSPKFGGVEFRDQDDGYYCYDDCLELLPMNRFYEEDKNGGNDSDD